MFIWHNLLILKFLKTPFSVKMRQNASVCFYRISGGFLHVCLFQDQKANWKDFWWISKLVQRSKQKTLNFNFNNNFNKASAALFEHHQRKECRESTCLMLLASKKNSFDPIPLNIRNWLFGGRISFKHFSTYSFL